MNEKKFELVDIGFVRSDGKSKEVGIVTNDGELIGLKEIVEVMNNLHKENELLQKTLDDTTELLNKKIMDCPAYQELIKENQQQKRKIEYLQKLRMEIRDVTIEEAIDKIKEMWE